MAEGLDLTIRTNSRNELPPLHMTYDCDRWRHRARVLEGVALLCMVTLLRRWVPMVRWQRLIGQPQAAEGLVPPTVALTGLDRRVGLVMRAAAQRVPFSVNCLDQAVAASLMLRCRGADSSLVIGLDNVDRGRPPHAWLLSSTGAIVVGGEVMHGFTPVTRFARRG